MPYTLDEQRGREDGHNLDNRLETERLIVTPSTVSASRNYLPEKVTT